MKIEKNTFVEKALFFLLAVGICLVEQFALSLFLTGEPSVLKSVGGWLVFLGMTVAGWWIAKMVGLWLAKGSLDVNEMVKVVGIGFGATYAVKIVGGIILAIEKGAEATTANQEVLNSIPKFTYALMAVLVAPMIEELVFRGLLMGRVFGQKSWIGLIISSLLFGALHVPTDLGSWILYGGMGLVLGLVYRQNGKLEYVIAIHCLNNLLSAIFLFFMN